MAGRWDIMALLGFHVFLFFCPRVSLGNGDDDEDDECARLARRSRTKNLNFFSMCAGGDGSWTINVPLSPASSSSSSSTRLSCARVYVCTRARVRNATRVRAGGAHEKTWLGLSSARFYALGGRFGWQNRLAELQHRSCRFSHPEMQI